MNAQETPRRWQRGDKFSASHLNQAVDLVAAASPLTTEEFTTGKHGTSVLSSQKRQPGLVCRVIPTARLDGGQFEGKTISGSAITDPIDTFFSPEDGEEVSEFANVVLTCTQDLVIGERYLAMRIGASNEATQRPVLEVIVSKDSWVQPTAPASVGAVYDGFVLNPPTDLIDLSTGAVAESFGLPGLPCKIINSRERGLDTHIIDFSGTLLPLEWKGSFRGIDADSLLPVYAIDAIQDEACSSGV